MGCGSEQQRLIAAVQLNGVTSRPWERLGLQEAVERAAEAMAEAQEVFGHWIFHRQRRLFRGTHGDLNPSLWSPWAKRLSE